MPPLWVTCSGREVATPMDGGLIVRRFLREAADYKSAVPS